MIFMVAFYHFHVNINVNLDSRLYSLLLLNLDLPVCLKLWEESVTGGVFSETTLSGTSLQERRGDERYLVGRDLCVCVYVPSWTKKLSSLQQHRLGD